MKKLLIALVLPQLAGVIGGLLTAPAINSWYQYLVKPSFSPPNWLFAPAWTTLYLLMGLSWYLAWKKGAPKGLFLIHLAFNSLWSVLFFGLKSPGLALVEIIVLWILILAVIFQFHRYSKLASWLLVPYLLWVSFAAYLNFSIFQLNFL
jgi:tryptophan-rich sensory protein